MRFWDASAIVPLCLAEGLSATAHDLAEADPQLAVWWTTRTECLSALARCSRDGQIDASRERQARGELEEIERQWLEIPPADEVRAAADRFLFVYPLRAADALQLAAAAYWREAAPARIPAGFVCLDIRLRQAAAREGFAVLPERL